MAGALSGWLATGEGGTADTAGRYSAALFPYLALLLPLLLLVIGATERRGGNPAARMVVAGVVALAGIPLYAVGAAQMAAVLGDFRSSEVVAAWLGGVSRNEVVSVAMATLVASLGVAAWMRVRFPSR